MIYLYILEYHDPMYSFNFFRETLNKTYQSSDIGVCELAVVLIQQSIQNLRRQYKAEKPYDVNHICLNYPTEAMALLYPLRIHYMIGVNL